MSESELMHSHILGHNDQKKLMHIYFAEIYNNSPEGIILVDQVGKIISVNKEFVKMFGYQVEELEGQNIDKMITDEALHEQASELTRKAATGEKVNYESKRVTKDNKSIDVSILGSPIFVQGKQIGAVGIYRNITERKEMERQIKYERDLFNAFMEHIPDSIYFKDSESRFLRVNKSTLQKFGLEKHEDIIGKSDSDFFGAEHASKAADDEKEILRSGKVVTGIQEQETYPNGEQKWVSTTKIPFTDVGGEIIGTCGITRDITSQKLAEIKQHEYTEELEKLNIAKDKFFSILAHDLRSPFTALLGYSEMLKEESDHLPPHEISELAGSVFDSANKIYQLLENLLNHSRSQLGRVKFKPENLNLYKAAFSITNLLSALADSKGIELVNNISKNISVKADVFMISTIFRNLISNAVKFTEIGGTVTVKATKSKHEVLVSVTDTGTGIPQDELDKLFNLEYGLTHPGTQNESGTGLGLILCKEFIEKHNGKIWAESEIGTGSSFFFSIPAVTK